MSIYTKIQFNTVEKNDVVFKCVNKSDIYAD